MKDFGIMDERIIFADENDVQIGVGTREEAWAKGLYVRIVRAILKDEKGRILSQHRSPTKKSYANCWTDSASGHVDEGESYDFAISRELKEEIGLEEGEVTEAKWFDIDELKSLITENPMDFTPGFKESIRLYYS